MSENNQHSTDDAGWHQWSGGSCPVRGDSLVEVRLRYAPVVTDRADKLVWHHDLYLGYGANDILAYRLAGADEI
jgi:hypothetical protein